MRGARLVRLALLVGPALGAAACDGTEGPDPAAVGPAPVVHAQPASPTSLAISWEAAEDPNRWWVIVRGPDGRSVGQRTACGSCREMTVEHLAPASEYAVRVVRTNEVGAFGEFGDPVAVATPPATGCDSVADDEVCAIVDATAPAGEASGVGLGFLHGVTIETDQSRVTALEPRAWRMSAVDVERFSLARGYGGTVTALLSDPWITSTGSRAPWADWEEYEAFVAGLVEGYATSGQRPEYWEVQNEPSVEAYEGDESATPDLVFEQFRRAETVIRERMPDAAVIGPSSSYVTFGSSRVADMEGFITRAAEAGVHLPGVAWHEIGAGCLGDCDGSPRAVLQHADDVRAALAAAGMDTAELHVNEWGAPWNHGQPGAVVGYLGSLAYAGIDVANPACWASSCSARPGTLDALLLEDGSTPTDAWFAHRAYAEMTGPGFELLAATIADPAASVVSTVDPSGTIRVLLGRHSGCDPSIDGECPSGVEYADDETVALAVAVDGASPSYTATVERIRSTAGRSTGPQRVAASTIRPAGGHLDIGSFALADGDAIVVTLVPAG